MKRLTRNLISSCVSFLLVLYSVGPTGGWLFADQILSSAVTLDASGQPVAVVSATAPQVSAEAAPEVSFDIQSSSDFLSDDNPLSPADDEIVSIASNDPFYNSSGSWGQSYDDLWWLKRVRADQAWSYSTGVGSTVAVIDTGVDYNHEDFNPSSFWTNAVEANGLPGVDDDGNGFIDDIRGWDFYNNDNNPTDDNDHGTMVAGIIGATTNNTLGIASIAPDSQIIPIKVLNQEGSGFVSHVIKAIRYAADLAADVINLSLGVFKNWLSKYWQSQFQSAVAYAKSKGSIVVAAAGNENMNVANSYPAGIRDVIAVGATDPNNNKAYFSNFGKLLDFAAPGVDILSLNAAGGENFGGSSGNPNYQRASGTSFSSPIVAGIVALLRGQNQAFTYDQIYNFLKQSAIDLGAAGFDNYYGWGLADALGAVTLGAQAVAGSLVSSSVSATETNGNGKALGLAKWFESWSPVPRPQPISAPTLGLGPLTHYRWQPVDSDGGDDEEEKDAALNYLLRKKSR